MQQVHRSWPRPDQWSQLIRQPRMVLTWLAILSHCACALLAQTTDEINAGIQLSFSPPGARSLAMGSAFSGLADDATAAYSNPAGLIWLSEPEVSVETRNRSYSTRYPNLGSATGEPTGIGIDNLDALVFDETEQSTAGLSFLSWVHVINRDWRIALYRHELADFKAEIESQGPFIRSDAGNDTRSRLAAVAGNMDLAIDSLSVATAYRASERLWLGAGISWYSISLNATTRRYSTILPRHPTSRAVFESVPLTASNESDRHEQRADGNDLAAHFGVLWKGQNNRWSLGLAYHLPPTFDLDYRFEWGARAIANAAGDADGDGIVEDAANLNFADPGVARALSGSGEFRVPDVLSLGMMIRPKVALTVSMEVVAVGYSRLQPRDNILLLGLSNGGSCGDFDLSGEPTEVPCEVAAGRLARFRVDDAVELHLGIEYVLRRQRPIALRVGAWHDPDHQLRFEGASTRPPEDRFAPRFLPGDDELHLTGGLGIALEKLQIDLAADLSERSEVISLSGVYRF